jgi:hypothetical protein
LVSSAELTGAFGTAEFPVRAALAGEMLKIASVAAAIKLFIMRLLCRSGFDGRERTSALPCIDRHHARPTKGVYQTTNRRTDKQRLSPKRPHLDIADPDR